MECCFINFYLMYFYLFYYLSQVYNIILNVEMLTNCLKLYEYEQVCSYNKTFNSKNFRNDLHELFYEELHTYATEIKFSFLLGDSNGSTGAETDIITADCFVFEQVDIDTADVFHDSLTNVLISNDISLTRVSKDMSTNRVGLNLVDFCKQHELLF